MDPMQYTVRGIPASVDARLREAARRSHRSLNATVVDILDRATRGRDAGPEGHDDLDWFIGSSRRRSDKARDDAHEWLDSLPNDLR